ncbi:MAG TPA: TIGR04282 family arsenosugar biosynthesis glycosyltransferase [Thermoanaerobaculia bacterium]|nr:TIGR04282 family arsenosugar biosynthesis glycosyltransferase [Thermoanaerobaculia bacterium]
MPSPRILLLFTKPARPGKVKTRLVGNGPEALSAEQAALLHQAFLDDLSERLAPAVAAGELALRLAWVLEEGDEVPAVPSPLAGLAGVHGVRQEGEDLGGRLFGALADAAASGASVAVVGSDHPTLPVEWVREAFRRLEAGADVALGPAEDGGYYLMALAPRAVHRRLFEDVAWSTGTVFAETLARCRELGLEVALLPRGMDVDEPADLARLAGRLAAGDGPECPRTRALLAAWGRLPEPVADQEPAAPDADVVAEPVAAGEAR